MRQLNIISARLADERAEAELQRYRDGMSDASNIWWSARASTLRDVEGWIHAMKLEPARVHEELPAAPWHD